MKFLVAYDGSEHADAALGDLKRAGFPDALDAVVLSVADVLIPPKNTNAAALPEWMSDLGKAARARAAEALREADEIAQRGAARLRADFPGWTVRADVVADSPAWGIVKKADEWGPDLVIVGSQGRSALGRLAFGSVAQKVAVEAGCSVRIARGRTRENASGARLLVCVDGSPDSELAVNAAAERSWPAGTAVRLITIIDSRIATALATLEEPARNWIRATDTDDTAWIGRMNESFAERLAAKSLDVSVATIDGDPKRALVEEAERWGADSIFVGARSLSKTERFLLGSVSAAVASRAHCSVEIVRAKRKLV